MPLGGLKADLSCVKYLQELELIPKPSNCDICGDVMKLIIKGPNQVQYRCLKRGKNEEHCKCVNALKNTFFEKSKFGIRNILTLMYFFARNVTNYNFLMIECSLDDCDASSRTIADWLSFCREVCINYVEEKFQNEEKLGGPGVVVEIDECKIGKRKYNRGRLVEGTWILGMIEIIPDGKVRGGRYRLEICPDNKRDAATLIPLIMKHVLPETTIVTDLWKSYFGLTDKGYVHFTVNHSKNFLDPLTGANTQTIESSWRSVKRSLKTGIRSDYLAEHLCEYLYRREVKMNKQDAFMHFVNATKALYPGI